MKNTHPTLPPRGFFAAAALPLLLLFLCCCCCLLSLLLVVAAWSMLLSECCFLSWSQQRYFQQGHFLGAAFGGVMVFCCCCSQSGRQGACPIGFPRWSQPVPTILQPVRGDGGHPAVIRDLTFDGDVEKNPGPMLPGRGLGAPPGLRNNFNGDRFVNPEGGWVHIDRDGDPDGFEPINGPDRIRLRNLKCLSWNTRGLFSRNRDTFYKKMNPLKKLLIKADVVFLQECHIDHDEVISGLLEAKFPGFHVYANPLSKRAMGTITLVKKSTFQDANNIGFSKIVDGGNSIVHVDTPLGSWGFVNVHLNPSNDGVKKDEIGMTDIFMSDKTRRYVVGGDFNFIAREGDHIARKADGSIQTNRPKEYLIQDFENKLLDRYDLYEPEQHNMTFRKNADLVEKLDRFYISASKQEIINFQITSSVHICPKINFGKDSASDHIPVWLEVKLPRLGSKGRYKLRDHTINHPGFKIRFMKELDMDKGWKSANPFKRLKAFKANAKKVGKVIERLPAVPASRLEDRPSMGTALFVRLYNGFTRESFVKRAFIVDPTLKNFVHLDDYEQAFIEWSNLEKYLEELRRKVGDVEDVREDRLEEDDRIKGQDSRGGPRYGNTGWNKKSQETNLLKSLKNMLPNKEGKIDAIMNKDGTITKDEKAMRKIINKHWQDVWTARPTKRDSAEFREDFKKYKESKNIPNRAAYKLDFSDEDLEYLILSTNNSAPGPDGLPFSLYRLTRDISAPLLAECTRELFKTGGFRPHKGFNHAVLHMLPKKACFE